MAGKELAITGTATVVAATALEGIPSGFNRPGMLLIAGGVAVAGALLDKHKDDLETEALVSNAADALAPQLADPWAARAAEVGNHRTRFREKAGYYGAVALASLAFVQAAGPFRSHARVKGAATFVENVNNTADTQDMVGAQGNTVTRLVASIDGSLAAAQTDEVPTAFILTGSDSAPVDSTPASGKNLKQTRTRINQHLNSDFRNGDELAAGISDALTAQGNNPNDIILVASALNADNQAAISTYQAKIKKEYPNDKLFAIVVGNSNKGQDIGAETLNAPVDVSSFQEALGKQNVMAASSVNEVRADASKIIAATRTIHEKQSINYVDLSLGFLTGAIVAAVAVRRRLSGLFKLRKLAAEGSN